MNININLIKKKVRVELFFILIFSLSLFVYPRIVGRSTRTVFYKKAVINVMKKNDSRYIVTATIPALGAVEVFPVPPREMHPQYNISYFECISTDIKLIPYSGEDGGEIFYRGGCSSSWTLHIRSLTPRKTNPSPKLVDVKFVITKKAMTFATNVARRYGKNKEIKTKSTYYRSIPFILEMRHGFIDLRGRLNSRGQREWQGDSSQEEWKSYSINVPLQINLYAPRKKVKVYKLDMKNIAKLEITHKDLTRNLNRLRSLITKKINVNKKQPVKWDIKKMKLLLNNIKKQAFTIKVIALKGNYKDKNNSMKSLILEVENALKLTHQVSKTNYAPSRRIKIKMNSTLLKIKNINDTAGHKEK